MAVDGYAGRERGPGRAALVAGWVPTVVGVAVIAEWAFVTEVTWPGW